MEQVSCVSFGDVAAVLPARARGKFVAQGECWVWTGYTRNGYGSVRQAGRNEYLHLLVYRALHGTISEGAEVDHGCRNRRCLRHLEQVSKLVNRQRQVGSAPGFCKNGHAMTPANSYYWLRCGWRQCRICKREAARRKYRRKHGTGNLGV